MATTEATSAAEGVTLSNTSSSTQETFQFGFQRQSGSLASTVAFYYQLFVFVFGFVGNCLTILVFTKTNIFQTTKIIFTILAVSDNLVLLRIVVAAVARHYFGVNFTSLHRGTCKLVISIAYSCVGLSFWMVVVLSTERMLAVALPLKLKAMVTRKRIIVCVLCVIALWAGWAIFATVNFDLVYSERRDAFRCSALKYSEIIFNGSLIFDNILPVSITAAENIIICVFLVKYKIKRSTMQTYPNRTNQHLDSKLMVTSLSICLTVILLSAPTNISFFAGEYIFSRKDWNAEYIFSLVSTSMFYTNFGINFYVYLAFTRSIRKKMSEMFVSASTKCWKRTAESTIESRKISSIATASTSERSHETEDAGLGTCQFEQK